MWSYMKYLPKYLVRVQPTNSFTDTSKTLYIVPPKHGIFTLFEHIMMSQEEILPWSEPDTNFFADNLLGIEDWGEGLSDIKLEHNDLLMGDKDQDMEVNTDDLSELLQNIGDDMWAISEDTVRSLGTQIKQEPPPSPSSSTSSLISLDSSLPSSPESQLLMNGQHSPPHQPSISDQVHYLKTLPIKTEPTLSPPPSCIRTEAGLTLPPSVKVAPANIKTESRPTPSCLAKKEPIKVQPCSLVKPLTSIPVGQVQKITLQNGQIPKILSQGTATTSSSGNITYIPVSGSIPTTAVIMNKQGATVPKPITTAVVNGTSAVKPPQNSVTNEKLMKRQQRMIKNRESACLSRKKKKEYLQSLENQVKEVSQLNDMLNEENTKLKKKVQELEKENILLKSSHTNWSSTAKKSTCVLAVVLLVALNIGPFSSLKESWKFGSPDLLTGSVHHGRALLQYEGDDAGSTGNNRPLVYGPLRKQQIRQTTDTLSAPSSKDNVIKLNTERKDLIVVNKWDFLGDMSKKKALLAKKERKFRNTMKRMNRLRKNKVIVDTICPSLKVNATESSRINEALGDWVHRYQVERLSRKQKKTVQFNKFKSKVKELALRLAPNCTEEEARRRVNRHMFTRRHNAHSSDASNSKNAVQLFKGPDWLELFSKAINRQEDTMYVVSFRKDHLVFPATKSNVTERPKMSLMMMAPPNGTKLNVTKDQDFISMIQIDCQVTDTKHIKIKKSSLPGMPFTDGSYLYNPSPQGYTQPPPPTPPSLPIHNAK